MFRSKKCERQIVVGSSSAYDLVNLSELKPLTWDVNHTFNPRYIVTELIKCVGIAIQKDPVHLGKLRIEQNEARS